jgi:hypothetical protein
MYATAAESSFGFCQLSTDFFYTEKNPQRKI